MYGVIVKLIEIVSYFCDRDGSKASMPCVSTFSFLYSNGHLNRRAGCSRLQFYPFSILSLSHVFAADQFSDMHRVVTSLDDDGGGERARAQFAKYLEVLLGALDVRREQEERALMAAAASH